MIGWLASAALAQSLCGAPDPWADVASARVAVDDAMSAVDDAAFDRAGKRLQAAIACLDRPPTPGEAALIHQSEALIAFVNGQVRASRRSLAAARLLDPSWEIAGRLFPPSHPYRDLYATANDPGPVMPIGHAPGKRWVVDGVIRDEAPTERAFLLQVLDGERIVWSGYLWSWDEIPDNGQSTKRDPLATPHTWWATALGTGGVIAARQDPASGAALWRSEQAKIPVGGATLVLRYTPVTVVGAEVRAHLGAPGDPVVGGDVHPAGSAVVLLGGGRWLRDWQPHASARLGLGVDVLRVWPTGVEPVEADISTIGALVLGVEGGFRTARTEWRVVADGILAGAVVPYGLDTRVEGGFTLAGPLALELGATYRAVRAHASDVDGSLLGTRRDDELRGSLGLGLWF